MVKRTSFSISRRSGIAGRVDFSNRQDENDDAHQGLTASEVGPGSIVIIEKRALIRDCLRRCFEAASEQNVIAVRSVDECLQISTTTVTSLVIFSVATHPKSPETLCDIGRLVQGETARPLIIVSDGDNLEEIVSVLDTGARGYIPTDLALEVAVEAVRLVCAGGVFIPASSLVGARQPGETPRPALRSANGIFTARQAAVVDAVRRGKANKVIAFELKMRESTVKVHVRNIMKKLNAKNRTEVAFMANELLKSAELPPMQAGR
ncbi:MAG: response regulator transcription factor [Sphingomonadales bacterium]|nr:response regulator transcription factor [Sphingomonadales bacterium]